VVLISILIDTNAYSAFKQNKSEALEIIQKSDFIGINSIVLGELRAGFAIGSRVEQNEQELQEF